MKNVVISALTLATTVVLVSAATPVFAMDAPAAATTLEAIHPGKMLVTADGVRLAPVLRTVADGSQVIVDGRILTVPAGSLALTDGRLRTTLTKAEVIALP